ncbi:phospholipase D family protein [Xanthobacter sp. VNH20]|uniref:phospholipase D family protein n=1 Tax=Xanthobacter TaxID=279 RepID=UPI0032B4BCF4
MSKAVRGEASLQFLDEKDALTEITAMLATASHAKLAVAFWGKDARERLGVGRSGFDVRIICNLDSGACNPDEIGAIIKLLPKERVFSDPRLHAKVYWTPKAAVIGSSNASTNGLAVEGAELGSWAEANILVTDPVVLKNIEEWFDRRLRDAYPIEDTHLKIATELWKRRARSAPPGARLSSDLLQSYQQAPGHPSWNKLRLAFWSEHIDEAGARETAALVKENPGLKDLEQYQGWTDELRNGEYLIDFDMSSGSPVFDGIYFVTDYHGPTISFVRKVKHVRLDGFPLLQLGKAGVAALTTIAPQLFEKYSGDGANALIDFTVAMKSLQQADPAKIKPTPDIKILERELRDTYTEASKLGYRPQRFLGMIDRLGPVDTVKSLLEPGQIPEGLSKLASLDRLDLSVEDIALRPEFAPLFTADELAEARRRLGRKGG